MGSLIKEKGHELFSFDYSNVMSDIFGDVTLSSKNLNPDPLFDTETPFGRMKYFTLGKAPRPDGWGVFVKGPSASSAFSEQNGYPLPLGDEPFFDLDQPLVNGAPLPEAREYVDIAQPEAPRAVILLTPDKAYPTGWYTAGHGFRMTNPNRETTPDPDAAGFIGCRTEPFQMSGSLGKAFYIPTPPRNTHEIVFYLSRMAATSVGALSALMYEQFAIKVQDNRSNIVQFKGPLKTGKLAPSSNRTKLEEWGSVGGFNIDRQRAPGGNQEAYDVQFAYDLVDASGHTFGVTSKLYHNAADSHKNFRFHPKIDSLTPVVKDSIKGWRPYIRYRKGATWGKWQTIKRKGADNVFTLDTWVEVYGPKWNKHTTFELGKGQPPTKDTTGIPNPVEPMTAVDATVPLDTSGLAIGKHRIKTVLYDGSEPSEPSEASVVDITASNQAPRVYSPLFTNRLDNPDLIDTLPSTNKPRDWNFVRDARTTYDKGKVDIDETDGLSARGDLLVTPYGYIHMGEMRYQGRVIVEMAEHVTGKAVDVLMEYHIDSYSALGQPNVTFLKQSTLGVHRRNGTYKLGFRTDSTRKRDSIPLGPTTNLVVIKTIADGSDANNGVRNYKMFRKGHGIFTRMTPEKRKIAALVDKVDWTQPDKESFPHGGYCHVVNNGEDPTIQGITMNMNDTGITIPTNTMLTGTSITNRTHEIRFRTGEDITTQQVLYREGNGTQGYAVYIVSGNLQVRAWQGTSNVVSTSVAVKKHQKYMASVVRDATSLRLYLGGVEVGLTNTGLSAYSSGGSVSAGYNTGTYRTASATTFTNAHPFLGRIYEIRVFNVARLPGVIVANHKGTIEDADDITSMALYLRMDEMEGVTTYDKSGNGSHGTIVGDSRWTSGDFDAGWRDASGVIDRLNFLDNTLPSPWSMTGTGINSLGDFSASRFSEFGMRVTATGTNTRYASRTVPGGYTSFAMGAQKRFITTPVGTDVTLLQTRDATGPTMEIKITAGRRLMYRANGSTAWTAFVDGIEDGERLYFEMKGENFGTANGIMRLYAGATHDEELRQVGMLTGINWTGRNVTSVRAGAVELSGTATNTWDYHMGEVILSTDGKVKKQYLPGNYIEYYGPDGTPPNETYGVTGLGIPVFPGDTMTHSIFAACSGLEKGEDQILGATFYNAKDEEVDQIPYLVDFNDIESEWRRYSKTFTVPSDAAYMMYDRNNIGQGTYKIQALQIEDGGTATLFTAKHSTTGNVRVKFDSVTPGCEPGKPMDNIGRAVDLLRMGFNGLVEDNEDISLQIASAATKNGTYSAYFTSVDTVPENRWYELKATLTTTDVNSTPILKGLWLNFQRPFPMLLKSNGEEYQGGTLINNMPPPADRRLVEVHQMDDGSGGFTTWGSDRPTAWIEPFEVNAFRDSTLSEITGHVGEGESTFMIEWFGTLYKVRVIDPIEFETRRASRIPLTDESEDFFRHVITMPRCEVIGSEEI